MSDSTILFTFVSMLIAPCMLAWVSSCDKKQEKATAKAPALRTRERMQNESMQRRAQALAKLESAGFARGY